MDKLAKQRAEHETVYEAAKEAATEADKKLRLARQDRHQTVVLLQNAEATLTLAKQTQAAANPAPSNAPAAAPPAAARSSAQTMAEAFKTVADFLRAGGTPADDASALLATAAAEGRSKQNNEAAPMFPPPGGRKRASTEDGPKGGMLAICGPGPADTPDPAVPAERAVRPKTVYEDEGLPPLGPYADPRAPVDGAPELSDGMIDVEVHEQVNGQGEPTDDAPTIEEGLSAG